jgi:hypothetical protein
MSQVHICMPHPYADNGEWVSFKGSLILSLKETSKSIGWQIATPLMTMLQMDTFTYLDVKVRAKLTTQWAQQFHGFLSSRSSPFWESKDVLWRVFGPNYKDRNTFLKMFRARVLKQLAAVGFVQRVMEKPEAIGIWHKG